MVILITNTVMTESFSPSNIQEFEILFKILCAVPSFSTVA